MDTVLLGIGALLTGVVVIFLVATLFRHIYTERQRTGVRRIWDNFGLGLTLMILFFTTWLAQGLVQWVQFIDEQKAHNEPVRIGQFIAHFSQSTLENWQSEFLQLFSFVVLAAMMIHHGSAESKDSTDRMERKIDEIKQMLQKKS